jgi:hypothetical protein
MQIQQLSFYSQIEKDIRKDEHLLWTGQPVPEYWVGESRLTSILFDFYVVIIGVSFTLHGWRFSIPDFSNLGHYLALLGLSTLLIPIGRRFGLSRRRKEAKSIHYLITDKQLLIVELRKITFVRAYPFKYITNIRSSIESKDIGSISFEDNNRSYLNDSGDRFNYSDVMLAVFPLSEVEALMRNLQEKTRMEPDFSQKAKSKA